MTAKYEAIQRWPISFLAKIQKERPLYIYIPNSIKMTWKKKNEKKDLVVFDIPKAFSLAPIFLLLISVAQRGRERDKCQTENWTVR